jgi:uncharacterized protein (TIGR02646 family)
MIRIAKTDSIPAILTTRGAAATQTNRDLYDANPAAYDAGIRKFDINADIYGHESVKTQLIDEQAGKCCFCEADFTANGYGDVEHFRPKAGYATTPSGRLNRPGYYWLAYDWQNLFFSCQICNQQYKRNYLPLDDEAQRARNHLFDHQVETLAILHPATDNPADHLTFNQHVISDITPKGKKSIKGFGLDRTKLNRVREQHLQNVRNNVVLAGFDLESAIQSDKDELSRLLNLPWVTLEALILTAKEFVAKAARADQPFALMVRCNFSGLPHE